MYPLKKIFTQKKFIEIKTRSNSIKASKRKLEWDSYDHYIEFFSKKMKLNKDSLILAMGVAYSWMPTMLSIYIMEYKDLDQSVKDVKKLLEIKSFSEINECKEEIIETIKRISAIINNSVVGTSKVLHFFSGGNIPIIDSRVIRAWNLFFRKNPEIKITSAPKKYVDYWFYLLYWKETIGVPSVRIIEKVFFTYGEKK